MTVAGRYYMEDKSIHISLEYAAGFIDADGCITCSANQSGTPDWSIIATQSEANGIEPLIGLKNRWGGSLCRSATRGKKAGKYKSNSDMYKWSARGIEAAIAISDMYPFFWVKKKKAEEALEYFSNHKKIGRVLDRIKEPRRC